MINTCDFLKANCTWKSCIVICSAVETTSKVNTATDLISVKFVSYEVYLDSDDLFIWPLLDTTFQYESLLCCCFSIGVTQRNVSLNRNKLGDDPQADRAGFGLWNTQDFLGYLLGRFMGTWQESYQFDELFRQRIPPQWSRHRDWIRSCILNCSTHRSSS